MSLAVRAMRVADFLAVPRDEFARKLETVAPLEELALAYIAHGPAFAALLDGQVAACAGVWINGSQGESWALVNHALARRVPLGLTRAVRRMLDRITRDFSLAQIICTVHPDNAMGARWAGACGFAATGEGVELGGETYNLYARAGI